MVRPPLPSIVYITGALLVYLYPAGIEFLPPKSPRERGTVSASGEREHPISRIINVWRALKLRLQLAGLALQGTKNQTGTPAGLGRLTASS